jgi:hypothetical protein
MGKLRNAEENLHPLSSVEVKDELREHLPDDEASNASRCARPVGWPKLSTSAMNSLPSL